MLIQEITVEIMKNNKIIILHLLLINKPPYTCTTTFFKFFGVCIITMANHIMSTFHDTNVSFVLYMIKDDTYFFNDMISI